ncbi:MAG: hypothetical protein V7K38_25770 [Nostoc sp.]|uniref:hypothetical protein n=1 Tax=Nostoc sp. TaxID=1180 RepID=UPI002FFC8AFE
MAVAIADKPIPNLPWSDLFWWYEAQITAPGIDAYGATTDVCQQKIASCMARSLRYSCPSRST